MRDRVRIENIEEMRLHEGIDDTELRKEIRALKVGDFVKLTLLARAGSFESDSAGRRVSSRSRSSAVRRAIVNNHSNSEPRSARYM